jgi:hypothetical protein
MSLIVILDIIGALLLGALVSFLATYYIQRTKIREMKKAFRTAIREEAKRSYEAGCKVTTAGANESHNKELEEAYVNGYDDGVKNEKYFASRSAKHASVADDDTTVISETDLILLITNPVKK